MTRILVPLADGCEELEAVTVIDLLRRAEFDVVTAGLADEPVRASRGVTLVPDTRLEAVLDDAFDAVVLPGGGGGAERLLADERVTELLRRQAASGGCTAAICAAPKVLAGAGLLEGRRATSFPGWLDGETGFDYLEEPVVADGKLVTSRGPGTAMDFALAVIELLADAQTARAVEAKLQRPQGQRRYPE